MLAILLWSMHLLLSSLAALRYGSGHHSPFLDVHDLGEILVLVLVLMRTKETVAETLR